MKKFFKRILMGIGLLVVLGVILAMIDTGEDVDNNTGKASSGEKVGEAEEKPVEEKEKKEEKKIFKVGDKIDLNGLELTIESAQFVDASEFIPAEKGKVLQMNLNIVNNKDEKLFVDSTEFNLYDTDDNNLEPYYGLDTLDFSSDINAGKKAQGTLTFDVPESESYELIYEPTFSWTEEKVTWEIKVQ
ncbi:DUF4352 domain-containing protein [Virgibacillus salexigens]|uniref:DUF4352 domain-containing protein n=1 Tax=Virgibacillus kapii TaxID=1638645 RepID=A0ABQ2D743_9BACI|nr:DUF4352 domain-containing protein [Virgibacillus kapii]GGJ48399.1 hypothetical protein GCM10007111_08080 [Virgibacillus kapii]